jgi:hypothetical protein
MDILKNCVRQNHFWPSILQDRCTTSLKSRFVFLYCYLMRRNEIKYFGQIKFRVAQY